MSVAAATREAVRNQPALYDALRAGVVNYTAAADSLDVDGDREAIATALRRFADELGEAESATPDRSITVRLHSDIDAVDAPNALLAVDGSGVGQPAGVPADDVADIETDRQTALRVTGDVDAQLLASTLDRLRIEEIPVTAAGVTTEALILLVPRRDGPTAVQLVETVVDI